MQERNFEKQVRDKMEEHSLVPSESVWQKVEKQIRKKKERRRVVLWLFTFILLPAGFLVWQVKEGSRRKDIAAASHQPASLEKDHQTEIKQSSAEPKEQLTNIADQPAEKKKRPEDYKEPQTGYSDQPSGIAAQQNETGTPVTGTNKQPGKLIERQTENSDQPRAVATQENQINAPLTGIKNQPEEIIKGRQTKSNKVATAVPVQRSRTGNNNTGTAKAIKTPFSKKQNREQPSLTNNKRSKFLSLPSDKSMASDKKKTSPGRDRLMQDKMSKNKTGINELVNAVSATSVSLKAGLGPVELLKAAKGTVSEEITTAGKPRFRADPATDLTIKKDKKWQWSIQASTGVSGIHKDDPKASELDAIIPSSQIVSGSASLPPSRIENGFSASGGLRLARKITARLSVTAALQYHFYSTRIRVGHTVYNDTTMLYSSRGSFRLGSYYLNNQPVNNYHNRYHFVELPLGVEYQLLHKRPLYGHVGVNLSQLTGTNALFYHDQAGIYFTGKSLFRKTQASAFGELAYRVARIGRASLVTGPRAQYALTGLMDKNVNGKQHLFFAGWNTRVYF